MGGALVFICLLAVTTIVGGALFLFAAYCFLHVVQETAAGVDDLHWPNEPYQDKLPRAAYVAALVAVWLTPVGLLLRLSKDAAIGGSALLTFFLVAAVVLWLFFPVSLLSSTSASSPVIILRPTLLRFMARRFRETVIFYLVSALLFAGSFGLYYLAYVRHWSLAYFVGPPLAAAAMLIYARLVGRLAWLFDRTAFRNRKRPAPGTVSTDPWAVPAETGKEAPASEKPRRKKKKQSAAHDPWAVPKEARRTDKERTEPNKRPMVEGYGLADPNAQVQPATEQTEPARSRPARRVKGYQLSAEPPPPQPRDLPLDGYVPVGYEPIPLKEPVPEHEPSRAQEHAESLPAPSAFERRLAEKTEEAPPPPMPLVSGVYTFPWYLSTLPVWIVLSVGGIALNGLIGLVISMMPT
jgi:hypothetical protein